jgi:hypothetical protein
MINVEKWQSSPQNTIQGFQKITKKQSFLLIGGKLTI